MDEDQHIDLEERTNGNNGTTTTKEPSLSIANKSLWNCCPMCARNQNASRQGHQGTIVKWNKFVLIIILIQMICSRWDIFITSNLAANGFEHDVELDTLKKNEKLFENDTPTAPKRKKDDYCGENYINADRFFMVASPMIFLVFNIVYWVSYGSQFYLAELDMEESG